MTAFATRFDETRRPAILRRHPLEGQAKTVRALEKTVERQIVLLVERAADLRLGAGGETSDRKLLELVDEPTQPRDARARGGGRWSVGGSTVVATAALCDGILEPTTAIGTTSRFLSEASLSHARKGGGARDPGACTPSSKRPPRTRRLL